MREAEVDLELGSLRPLLTIRVQLLQYRIPRLRGHLITQKFEDPLIALLQHSQYLVSLSSILLAFCLRTHFVELLAKHQERKRACSDIHQSGSGIGQLLGYTVPLTLQLLAALEEDSPLLSEGSFDCSKIFLGLGVLITQPGQFLVRDFDVPVRGLKLTLLVPDFLQYFLILTREALPPLKREEVSTKLLDCTDAKE